MNYPHENGWSVEWEPANSVCHPRRSRIVVAPRIAPSTWSASAMATSTPPARTTAFGWRVRAARWSIGARTMT